MKRIFVFTLVFLATIMFTGCTVIPEGNKAVKFTLGKAVDVVDPGLQGYIPGLTKFGIVPVTTEKVEAKSDASSKDLQRVSSKVVVNYKLNNTDESLLKLTREVGISTIGDKIIAPRIQESFKAVTAKYSAEELILRREDVKSNIELQLTSSLAKYGIILESFNIVDFDFSKEFNEAIEAKQTAVQQTLKAENDLQRIEVEARQTIAKAEAEAKSIQIQAQAIREQGGAEYVKLQSISRWNGVLPTTMTGDVVPFINIK